MDVKDIIKYQIMQGHSAPDRRNFGQSIKYLMLLGIAEETLKHVGAVGNFIKSRFQKRVHDAVSSVAQVPLSDSAVLLDKKHPVNQVRMRRVWRSKATGGSLESFQETNMLVDAVIHFIGKLDNIPSLVFIENAQTLVNYMVKPIQITREIFVKVDAVDRDSETGVINGIVLILSSNELSAADITRWTRGIYKQHRENIKNSLGDTIYFFDHKFMGSTLSGGGTDPRGGPNPELQKQMMLLSAPKAMGYVKSPFYSNKTFKNIYGKGVRRVESRVKFFLENKDWYDSRGIPYQLGILLSGIPGSGKTSIIRALANLTKRHIINVNFANIQTTTQLKNLFFNDKLICGEEAITIPVDQRIYVLEEIDTVGDIVKQRSKKVDPKSVLPDELTLGEILTVLDGTQEVPGRIIVMTSNCPDELDRALIRPGRVDVCEHFDYAERDLVIEMYESFFDKKFPDELVTQLPDKKFTAAEISQKMFGFFNNSSSPEDIIKEFVVPEPEPEPEPELGEDYSKRLLIKSEKDIKAREDINNNINHRKFSEEAVGDNEISWFNSDTSDYAEF